MVPGAWPPSAPFGATLPGSFAMLLLRCPVGKLRSLRERMMALPQTCLGFQPGRPPLIHHHLHAAIAGPQIQMALGLWAFFFLPPPHPSSDE
ncbi:hypothetical protein ACRRTK_016559 [Alexandromys fortis]